VRYFRRAVPEDVLKKILVVEDDPINAQILADFLGANGYATAQASNGTEGIERFRSEHPDLMLVDMNLGDMTGIELARALHRDRSTREIRLVAKFGHSSATVRYARHNSAPESSLPRR